MEMLILVAAIALTALLVARELWWRREAAVLRERLKVAITHGLEREQLANVGQLVSGLAQQLKSPLQGVLGNTELLIALARPGSGSEDLRDIQQNAARAVGIVRNLLAFTETAALSHRWQNLNDIVRRAIESCRQELDAAGVRVRIATAERLPLVYVDGRQLEKAIATLVSRPAPRSMDDDGTAAVTLVTRRRADDRLVIEIDDRTAADQTDDSTWSGELDACRRIMEAHGGSLEVGRSNANGFRFQLELPVTAGGAEATFNAQVSTLTAES
jgi:K+-sensing histidine kinase KdpD